jgi:hypothetical protein
MIPRKLSFQPTTRSQGRLLITMAGIGAQDWLLLVYGSLLKFEVINISKLTACYSEMTRCRKILGKSPFASMATSQLKLIGPLTPPISTDWLSLTTLHQRFTTALYSYLRSPHQWCMSHLFRGLRESLEVRLHQTSNKGLLFNRTYSSNSQSTNQHSGGLGISETPSYITSKLLSS